jgi:RNA polymerase Rpb2, domain 6
MDRKALKYQIRNNLVATYLAKVRAGQRLDDSDPSPLHYALKIGADLETIKLLLENGAKCNSRIKPDLSKVLSKPNKTHHDVYPITIAIKKKLDISYIKLLDQTKKWDNIPPVHLFAILPLYKPSNEIVEHILEEIDKYVGTTRLADWLKDKWDAQFWSTGVLINYSLDMEILLPWNHSRLKQEIGRGIRTASHKELPDFQSFRTEHNASAFLINVNNDLDTQLENNDKICSRAAQMGTIGIKMERSDMPYDEHGIRPDVSINKN